MKAVLTLACLLAAAYHVSAQCGTTLKYTETFIPQCASRDLKIKWPNYENLATYYQCNGIGTPVVVVCPSGQYFSYVMQQCVGCDRFLPPVRCSQLRTQNQPRCVPMGSASSTDYPVSPSGPSYPTPFYPGSNEATPSAQPTPESGGSVTTEPTLFSTPPSVPATVTGSVPSPQVVSSSIAPPPSPYTRNPYIPEPPTPNPTPPTVQDVPPSIA